MGTAPYRAFLGGGFGHINTPAPVDGDGDGIPNAIDDCPDEPESYNGWRDSDGCPDSLGTLAISGTYKGAPHGSVKATVTGDGGARSMGPGEVLYVPDIMPGTVVTVDLVAGGCLAGSAEVEAYEGQREISIPLDRSLEGSIQFEVNTLQDQQPIPGATVKIRSEESDCGASEKTLQLGDSGTGVAAVGAGDHVVVIDVPNYALYRNKITVKPGGTETVSVSLKKSKTRVTAQRIEIFEKVHFETGKAIIKPESYDLLDEVATVIHLAAQTIVPIANRNPISTLETNVAGTWTLLEACRRSPTVGQVVLASSDKAYGTHEALPYDEDAPLQGRFPYDVS